jgi:DMSO/TMAO reductase YedYZ molybdopterin-dependent catalytic subunit
MSNKKKKLSVQTIIIIVTIASLASLLAIFSALNRQDTGLTSSDTALKSGTFTVVADGAPLKTYSIDELKDFPQVEVYKDIASGKHDDESGLFRGAPLEEILDDAEPGWRDKYREFIFRAEDAFTASVFASDIEKGGNVLIVYAQDGAPIPGGSDGGKGPIRALIVDDKFGNRSAQMLISVELNE